MNIHYKKIFFFSLLVLLLIPNIIQSQQIQFFLNKEGKMLHIDVVNDYCIMASMDSEGKLLASNAFSMIDKINDRVKSVYYRGLTINFDFFFKRLDEISYESYKYKFSYSFERLAEIKGTESIVINHSFGEIRSVSGKISGFKILVEY